MTLQDPPRGNRKGQRSTGRPWGRKEFEGQTESRKRWLERQEDPDFKGLVGYLEDSRLYSKNKGTREEQVRARPSQKRCQEREWLRSMESRIRKRGFKSQVGHLLPM